MELTQRLAAALGIKPKMLAPDASAVVAALMPGMSSLPPERGVTGMLNAYNNSPWVRAVTSRISTAVGATSWQIYGVKTVAEGRYFRSHVLQANGIKRRDFKRRSMDLPEGSEIVELLEHPLLELLNSGSYRMPGSIGRQMTQLYLELAGEAFWLLEPRKINGAVVPVGFWVIPPTWVQDVPQSPEGGRYYLDGGHGHTAEIPAEFMLWFSMPNPINPYARGVGHLRAFGDEIDTDEFTAKYIRSFFYNSARPDLLVYGKDLQAGDVQRLEYGWMQKVRGFLQAHKPFFLNRDVTVKELTYKFQEMQMVDLRKWERDVIVNGRGVPPEVLGIVENSNRATINAADYLFSKGVVEPALEFLRTFLQSELVPKYDERIVLGYDSPVEEDWEFQLKAMEAAPWAASINEWRAMQGLDAIENGDKHVFNLSQTAVDLDDPTATLGTDYRNPPSELAIGSRHRLTCGCETHVQEAPGTLRAAARGIPPIPAARSAPGDPGVKAAPIGGPHNVDLAAKLGKQMMDDLLAAWEEIKGSIDMKAFRAALQAGDLERAIAIIESAPVEEIYADAQQTMKAALYSVGKVAAEEVAQALGVDFSFEMISPEALQELQQFGAGMVTNVSDATRAAIRTALTESYADGKTVEETARRIRAMIGLTERDWKALKNLRLELDAQGLPYAEVERKLDAWIAHKLVRRAEIIAHNELVYAANRGQEMAWEAAAKAGLVDVNKVRRIWIGGTDINSCEVCIAASGTLAPIGGEYPNGMYTPNDSHVSCRCTEGLIWL